MGVYPVLSGHQPQWRGKLGLCPVCVEARFFQLITLQSIFALLGKKLTFFFLWYLNYTKFCSGELQMKKGGSKDVCYR